MLTPEQCRAARGWLNWRQSELASRTNLSIGTICRFERGNPTVHRNNILAMEMALQDAGMKMVWQNGRALGVMTDKGNIP